MPGKHQESWVARLSRNRYPLVIAVVLLCIGVAGVFAAVSNRRSPSRPLMYLPVFSPSAPLTPAPSASPSPSLSQPSSAPSALPSPSLSQSPSASSSPSPSRSKARPTSRPPAPPFTARYVVVDDRRSSFSATVVITNTGKAARSWRLVVTHDPDAGVRVQLAVGAEFSMSGNTITLRGDALQPGRSVTVSFRATSNRTGDDIRPTSCIVEGTACDITSR